MNCTGGRELAGLGIEFTPDGRMGPQLGAQFAQLVKELRSEYAAAITGCAQRIATVAFSMGPRILTRLQQHGLTGNPAQTAQEVLLDSLHARSFVVFDSRLPYHQRFFEHALMGSWHDALSLIILFSSTMLSIVNQFVIKARQIYSVD